MEKNIDYYRQKLKTARHQILTEIDNFTDHGGQGMEVNIQDVTGDLSNYDNHPADSGNTMFEREKDLGFQGRAKFILKMIDDALDKIDSGHYGECDWCGEEIADERLEVMPYSTMCKECKENWEASENNWDRPIEEEVISQSAGGKFSISEGADNNIYDGEDTWQQLARVGTSNTPSDIPGAHNEDDSYIDADERPSQSIKEIKKKNRK